MRALLATMKPVWHVPAGILATIAAMSVSAVVAVSSPYPQEHAAGWTVKEPPKIVTTGIPAEAIHPPIIDFSFIEDEENPRDEVAEARAYLVKTAFAGGTMTMLGKERSIGCFDPHFSVNLAASVKDAREHGFPSAGVLSGCRPPKLGIGGFKDKRNSLHAVGLAADMHGIGAPCSASAKRFHQIAAKHGVAGVYGPCNRAEWNHMQGTRIKMTTPALRATITKKGDIAPDLNALWRVTQRVALAVAQPITTLLSSVNHPAVKQKAKRVHVAKRHKVRKHRVVRRHKVRRRHIAQIKTEQWAWQ